MTLDEKKKEMIPTVHKCIPPTCKDCNEVLYGDGVHECYIQPLPLDEKHTERYLYYDFETRYENGQHVANFVAVKEWGREEIWYNSGPNCVKVFLEKYRKHKYNDCTFVAHNAAGFDNYIILEELMRQNQHVSLIMQNSRIVLMRDTVYNQRYIDSYSFMPMRLANTPKAFGFDDEVGKGYFPHRFNTAEHDAYKGPYPGPSYYGYDEMTAKDQDKFTAWYDTVKHETFDFQHELKRYGKNDVFVLHKACTTFRNTFIENTGIDPFKYTTLAASCMAVYKTLFMPKNEIALTYNGTFISQKKSFSNVSIEWLEYVKHSKGIDIQHALNRGEYQVGRYHLDGYDAAHSTCYSFAGCFYHGCKKCYREGGYNTVTKCSYAQLNYDFVGRKTALEKEHNLTVKVMWECEWRRLKKTDPNVKAFMENYKAPARLDPREALFGGRTNAMTLSMIAGILGLDLTYVDFTSLYPFVQATEDYPIGMPVIILSGFESITKYFGFVKCIVNPPRKLYHPVLPYRCHGKLMFPLCRTCAEELNQTSDCTHDDVERQLEGVWVTCELIKALEKGYTIASIDEIWHFPKKSSTLFKGYVQKFLKSKQEASGYPAGVDTDQEKDAYISDYLLHEGILLDKNKIGRNESCRSISKLLLNSLWGRFCMNPDKAQTEVIIDPQEFAKYMFSNDYIVKHFSFLPSGIAIVQYMHAHPTASRMSNTNIFIGAMTTAFARLRLYNVLDKLERRAVYCDTDSIILYSKPGDWRPPTGPYLGDLTDELCDGSGGDKDYITDFVSGGPKAYAYKTAKGRSVVKWKGVTLNARNAAVVTHDALKKLVATFVANQTTEQCVYAKTGTIVRNKATLQLKNATLVKRVRIVYNKRRVLPDYTTLPYGY